MDSFQKVLDSHESWLTDRIISYVRQSGCTEYSSTMYEAWRLSVADLSASLAKAVPALLANQVYQIDSFMNSVVLEAQRHRERGIRLGTFLGLFKHYRQAYHDLLDRVAWEPSTREQCQRGLHKCLDRAEIRFCDEWNSLSAGTRVVTEARGLPEQGLERLESLVEERTAELRHANAKLHRAETEWRQTFDAVPQDIAILDETGVVIFANKAWAAGTHDGGPFAHRSTVGTDFLAICDGVNSEGCAQASEIGAAIRSMLSGQSTSFLAEFPCHDSGSDHERWVCFTASSFSLAGSRRVLILLTEITDRKRAEKDLERKNEFLTTVLESLTHPFMVIDAHDFSVSLSNSASGIPPSLDRPKCYEVSHGRSQPCDGVDYPCPVRIVAHTGACALGGTRAPDGQPRSEICRDSRVPGARPTTNVTQVIQYMVDITQRKTAEVALRESEQKLDGILGSITDHLIMTDSDHRIIWANDVAKGLFGSDLCGKRCFEVLCARSPLAKNVPSWTAWRTEGRTTGSRPSSGRTKKPCISGVPQTLPPAMMMVGRRPLSRFFET